MGYSSDVFSDDLCRGSQMKRGDMRMPLINISGQEREAMVALCAARISALKVAGKNPGSSSEIYSNTAELRVLSGLYEKLAAAPAVVIRDESGVVDGEALGA